MRKILTSIFILTLIYGLYFFGLPKIANPEKNKDLIVQTIQKELGVNVDYKNAKIKSGFTPSIWLTADEFSISERSGKPLLVKNPKVEISLFPLLFNEICIKNFYSDKIDAKMSLNENKQFFIGDYLIIKNSKSKISLKNAKVNISSYNINFNDKYNKKDIIINGTYFIAHSTKKWIDLNTHTIIKLNGQNTVFNTEVKIPFKFDLKNTSFNGTISNLNLKEIEPYLKLASQDYIEKIQGLVNIQAKSLNSDIVNSNTKISNFSLKLKGIAKPFFVNEDVTIHALTKIKGNYINIKDLKVRYKDVNIDLNGSIANFDNPRLNLNLKIKDTKSENVLGLIPYADFPDVDLNLKAMRDYGIYSVVNGSLDIIGNAKKPELNGEFIAKDVYILRPLDIPKATIKLKFVKDKVHFDAFVPASLKENVTVKGYVELFNKKLVDFTVNSTQNVNLKIAEIVLKPLHEMLNFELGPVPIMDVNGLGNIKLRVTGNKISPHLFGIFNFKNGKVKFDDLNALLKNGSGSLHFNDENMHFETKTATLNSAPIKIEGDCNVRGILSFDVSSNGLRLNEALKILNTSDMLNEINKMTKPIKAGSGKIDLKFNLKGQAKHIEDFIIGKNITTSGSIRLFGNDVMIFNSDIVLNKIIGNISFKNFDVDFNLKPLINNKRITFIGKIKDNKIYSKNKLNNLDLSFKDSHLKFYSGNLDFEGDKIILNKINADIDSKPILLDGRINNIDKKPTYDIYVNSKPNQKFIDKYLNKKMIAPLIIKGDIDYFARITGDLNSANIRGKINLQKAASIYFKGASLGDMNNPIALNLDANLSRTAGIIRSFRYSKIEDSGKEILLLNASGTVKERGNRFENIKIKTHIPTDAKIFNIIFKKPLIKEGLFTSNLTINGDVNSLKVLGTFNLFGVNIPFMDTTIKDISLNFKDKIIELRTKGEVFSNEILLYANLKNTLNPPYIINHAQISLGNLNVNAFLKHLDKINLEDVDKVTEENNSQNFDINLLTINNLNLKARSVYVRNLSAKNVDVNLKLKKGVLSIDKLRFVTAEGVINGDLKYNFNNSKMSISMLADGINANLISQALFDIKNQIYGKLTGEIYLSCDGKSHKTCMRTLNGSCGFRVKDGRMPQLGSLEYLLKSSSVIKSGVTGLTVNNIIDILTPLKTGDFESITGNFNILKGKTNDINIMSKGKNLSIFITGKYDFSSSVASLDIYGKLSKKISNALGFVGNASINTLFNLIPGVNLSKSNQAEFIKIINKIPMLELNTKDFRIFNAKIEGDLNSEDYVQSFKWID